MVALFLVFLKDTNSFSDAEPELEINIVDGVFNARNDVLLICVALGCFHEHAHRTPHMSKNEQRLER